jgi:methylmalonyl-CoA/ethylmalonyl-CoA epimerase
MEDNRGRVHLDEIGQIALTVMDLESSKTFYEDVLGMKFLFDAGTMAFFQCGALRLMVGSGEQTSPGGGTILYFRVRDMEGVHAALTEAGVQFTQPPHLVARMKTHDLWLADFRDPSGNLLALMEEKSRSEAAR